MAEPPAQLGRLFFFLQPHFPQQSNNNTPKNTTPNILANTEVSLGDCILTFVSISSFALLGQPRKIKYGGWLFSNPDPLTSRLSALEVHSYPRLRNKYDYVC